MSDATLHQPSKRALRLAALIAAVLIVLLVVWGIASRVFAARDLHARTDDQAVPTVKVVAATGDKGAAPLLLPGRLEAYARAPIYARVSGYLKSWKADIGTPVKAGQLLGEIETPDLDQQLMQTRASLASAKADAALAGTTAKRWKAMLSADSVSQQEADEKSGDFIAKQAMQRAAQADVDRLQALKGFARLIAPFDGTVTVRNTDVGALINAGGGTGPELFEVSDTRRLRVYVRVPQSSILAIRPGAAVAIEVPEHPGERFMATVESLSGAIDAASGTTLVQLAIDNADGRLTAGGYSTARFDLPANARAVSVPASALVIDGQGTRVAVLGAQDKVAFKKVSIGRDLGKTVEISAGLSPGERVIDSPPDGLADGDRVKLAKAAPQQDGKQAGAAHANG